MSEHRTHPRGKDYKSLKQEFDPEVSFFLLIWKPASINSDWFSRIMEYKHLRFPLEHFNE